MAEDDKEQRTEDASDRKREETTKKGRTAQSKEVGSTVVLLAALSMLYIFGNMMRTHLSEVMVFSFSSATHVQLTETNILPLVMYYFKEVIIILAPIMSAVALAGIAASILQNGGIVFSLNPLMPDFSKVSPMSGFGRLFGKTSVAELFKSMLKMFIVGYICYLVLVSEWVNLPVLSEKGVSEIAWFISKMSVKLMFYVLLLMLALAAADFAFQKYTFSESIKMTKQEVKDEHKDTEGDPMVKQRIRSAQYAMSRKRMMQDVPKADVVITNPTHLAVAISYEKDSMAAPKIVAMGSGHVAAKIREIAKEHNVPIVEDKPLARLLFNTLDIGQSIPEELYRAIAEILAFVYKLKNKVF